MMDELTITLLTSEFGQVWARYDFVQRVAQNRSRLWATCCTKSHRAFGNMLHKIAFDFGHNHNFVQHASRNVMGLWHKIAYDFGQDRIRLWAGLDKIWYDATNLKPHMHLIGSGKLENFRYMK